MASKLVWRRCGACNQLTLVPATTNVCWQCGAPIQEAASRNRVHEPDSDNGQSMSTERHITPEADAFRRSGFRFGHSPDQVNAGSISGFTPADVNHSRAQIHSTGITPADDAIAHRLLESVFPDGIDFP